MKCKPVVPRLLAKRDVEDAIDWYLLEAGERVTLRFIDELERAYLHIARHPATGSTRYSHELGLQGLRSWALTGYPYIVFYVENTESIDVWRVLHGQKNIPEWMQSLDGAAGSEVSR